MCLRELLSKIGKTILEVTRRNFENPWSRIGILRFWMDILGFWLVVAFGAQTFKNAWFCLYNPASQSRQSLGRNPPASVSEPKLLKKLGFAYTNWPASQPGSWWSPSELKPLKKLGFAYTNWPASQPVRVRV